MARCETCGNEYDKAFQVTMKGSAHTFDSFECAIHALPRCVITAAVVWWGMASKKMMQSSAVLTALSRKEHGNCATAHRQPA